MNYRLFFIAILVFAAVSARASGDRLLHINDETQFFNPATVALGLVDREGTLGINDILKSKNQKKFFAINSDTPNFGISEGNVWLKFSIENLLDDSPWLEIKNPDLDSIEYYLVNNSGVLVHHHITGKLIKLSDREISSGRFLFDLHIGKSEKYTVYLKANTNDSFILLPVRIASIRKFYESGLPEWIFLGMYFGFTFFLVVYNLFLSVSLKDRTYFYFAVFIALISFLFAIFKGVGTELLWGNHPIFNQFTVVASSLAGAFMIFFTARFLQTRERYPIIHKWILAMAGFYLIIIGIDLAGYGPVSTRLMVYNSLTGMLFFIILAAKAWHDGYEPAKYYLSAWSFYMAGLMVHLLREHQLIEINFLTENILVFSASISILLMSFALSKKINIYIKKRNEAQEIALYTALENERLISDQNQLLEARVRERTIDLQQSILTLRKQRKELKEINDFKDKVFSIISHDLKSPITTLAGLLQIMKMKNLNEKERSKAIKSLEIALKSTKSLLDNILTWANKNKKHGEEQEFEIYGVVKEIIQLFQLQCEAKNITIQNTIEPGFHIITSKDMLELVLRNLISNAIKFTPRDGTIKIGMRQDYLNLYLYVKDSGVGMSEEVIANLFKSNKHVSTRGTENEKGTGLGLLLCKEFLQKHNGSLHVESRPGKGSVFTIKLKNAIPVLEVLMN